MLLDRQHTLAVIQQNIPIPFSQENPFNPVSAVTSVQKPQPWRDIVKKKLGTAVLLITLACGVANADNISPCRHAKSQQTTWMQKIDRAFAMFKAWF